MLRILTCLIISLCSFISHAQSGKFIKDQKTGCLIWNENPGPLDSAAWKGRCIRGYAEGKGTLRWFSEGKETAKYSGILVKGNPYGQGKYEIHGWGVMEGNFQNGMLNGQGTITFQTGGKLKGNFSNGYLLDLDSKYLKLLRKNILPIKDQSGIYLESPEKDQLFYYVLAPAVPKGVLVLFPSTSESAENVISSNKQLIQRSYENGILSIILSANYNKDLLHDKAALDYFNTVFAEVILKYKAPKDKFILSGLSLGGNNALQYTILSRSSSSSTSIVPVAVIGVDPPVDYIALYNRAKDEIDEHKDSLNLSPLKKEALAEDNFLMDYYHGLYGGPPQTQHKKYVAGSQYSRSEPDGGNAKYLINVPVRIYSDPDILWQMKHKSRDYYHMNAPDQSAMILFLQRKGNKQAEFVSALGKGYRIDGSRHPHSWSIVDPQECIRWMLKMF